MRPRYEAFDRHLPIDGRILLGVLGAADDRRRRAHQRLRPGRRRRQGRRQEGAGGQKEDEKPKVAVLNATQTEDVQGVPGLADKVASEVVKQLGYPIGAKTNAPTGFAETVVMYEPDAEGEAAELARGVSKQLGETETEEMAADIRASAGDAKLVLVVGADDAQF